MKFGINTLDDVQVSQKTVICRADLNQPVDLENGALKSIARIKATIPTIRELMDKQAKVVILAHQGSDIEYKNFTGLGLHREALEELLGRPVGFIDDVCGPAARARIKALGPGEALLLDNVRFQSEEQTLFEQTLQLTRAQQAKTQVVRALAPLADLYVCDAFSAAHRSQPSLCGFEEVLPSAMGRLFELEYGTISGLMKAPKRPCVFVLGGSKVADAFHMMKAVLASGAADQILTGGLVANVFLAASGKEIGRGSKRIIGQNGGGFMDKAGALLKAYGGRILLPSDVAYLVNGERREADVGHVPEGACLLDIGSATCQAYAARIRAAGTVFANGPMGVFEQDATQKGTAAVWDALGDSKAFTVVGGGDSIRATVKYGKAGLISYISTGGGALIRFLSGEELPVVCALRHSAEAFGAR